MVPECFAQGFRALLHVTLDSGTYEVRSGMARESLRKNPGLVNGLREMPESQQRLNGNTTVGVVQGIEIPGPHLMFERFGHAAVAPQRIDEDLEGLG